MDTIDPADLAARPLVVPALGADPLVFERLLRRKDGTTFPAEASVKRLPDGRTQSIMRDITERTAAAAAVRASEARYRRLFAEAERQARELALLDRVRTALAAQLDERAIARTVADALAEDLGYTRQGLFLCDGERLVGETRIGRDYHPFAIALTEGMMGRVARAGRAELVTDVGRDPDFISAHGASGSAIAVPLRDGDELLGILNVESESAATLGEADLHLLIALAEQVGIALGRARRHAALRRSEVGLAEAQRLARIGSWEYDIVADRLTWSDEIFRILGHAPQSFTPTQERLLAAIHPDDRAEVLRARVEGLGRDGQYDVEHRIVRPDGTVRMAHQRTEIVRDAVGRPIKRQGIIQDVTERRALEATLRLQNAHLAALSETGRALSGELDLDRALDLAWAQIARVSGVADGWIALLDEKGGTLNYRDFVLDGVRRPEWEDRQPRAAGGLGWAVVDMGTPLRVPDYAAECRRRGVPTSGPLGDTPGITWLGLPLVTGGQVIGALAVWRAIEPFTDEEEVTLATLAGQVAAALANARLYAAARMELAERVRAEEALRASEASLAAAQALAHLGNWEVDLTTGESRWSVETFR
ncbi:MAG TPA: GAF domain-containing protein, partial [Thermomicrobiales bacterium]